MPIATDALTKQALRVDGDFDDALITVYNSAADGAVRDYLGNTFVDAILDVAEMATAPTGGESLKAYNTAVRQKSQLFSALVFYARELYELNPHELTPLGNTPHAFYRILRPLGAKRLNDLSTFIDPDDTLTEET